MSDYRASDMYVKGGDDKFTMAEHNHQCVICDDTRSLGVQYGGKGGFIRNGERYIHAICHRDNIRLLICNRKLIENISFDPLSVGWFFYNWNDEYGRFSHVDPELIYCPFCSKLLSEHECVKEIDKPKEKEEPLENESTKGGVFT